MKPPFFIPIIHRIKNISVPFQDIFYYNKEKFIKMLKKEDSYGKT